MIKKILSLVIFGVLTFGMLFATEATVNLKLTLLEIPPQYTMYLDTVVNGKTANSGDANNTLTITDNTTAYYYITNEKTITVYVDVVQTNFARYKSDVTLRIEVTPLILYKGDTKTSYKTKSPTIGYAREHVDSLALTIAESFTSKSNGDNTYIEVLLDYNALGFPVLANTQMFRLGITYPTDSIIEPLTTETRTDLMPVGEETSKQAKDNYYKSIITLTYTAN